MAPPWKNAFQVAIATTSKGKSITIGDSEPIEAHPPHLEVHIEDVGKDHSFLAVIGGRDQKARNSAPCRRATPPNARQPPKAIGRVTGGCGS